MNKTNYLLFLCMLAILLGCKREDDKPVVVDDEEYFTATIVTSFQTINFTATTDGVTDYIYARLRESVDGDRLYVTGKDFENFLDIDFEVGPFSGSGTFTTGDSEDNPNYARYGQGRSDNVWWTSSGQIHMQVTTGEIVINDAGAFLMGTVSFQGFRQGTLVQVDGNFKVRKDY